MRLYPPRFRAEFAEEMGAVFAAAAAEAEALGKLAALLACWRELRDAPGAIIGARLAERRYSMNPSTSPSQEQRSSWAGMLAGAWPFLMFGPITVLLGHVYPTPTWREAAWVQALLLMVYLLPLVIGFCVGWARRWPRWAYPYAGMALWLMAGGVSAALWSAPFLNTIWNGSVTAQILTIPAVLLLLAAASLVIARGWRPLHSLYRGIRQDWTRLSFGLYLSASLIFAAIDHDEDPVLTPAILLPTVIVLFGALAYLLGATKAQRALALVIGYAAAVIVRVTDGVWYYGIWGALMAFIIIVPALLDLLPRPGNAIPAA